MGSWFHKKDNAVLPERVQAAIRHQEDVTERLVSWFQLAVVLILGALYLLGPKPPVKFDIIPWALAIYLALTVIRVIWSHRGHLPAWSVAVSVFFDIALLLALIWSFHLRYDQPPSFYLKAPTLLYVFIFIALRALRFEARFVVLTGVMASLGWGVLMAYVVYSDPTNTMITRDYVEYMTSNSILVGAELDKIISILMVTAIIAVSLVRAKALLIGAVADQTAARELSRFFAPEIAEKIKASDQQITAGSGETREASIVNLDMRGFTRLAATVTPAEAMSLLADYQGRMVPIIHRHGGSIDKFLGDGIMATFGAAMASETHAADALRALQACVEDAASWRSLCLAAGRTCPEVNGAMASGRILFGAVGDAERLEYTVIGGAVNLSAKLEQMNKQLITRAVCDRSSLELAARQGFRPDHEPRHLAGVTVPGLGQPVDLVVLQEGADAAAQAMRQLPG